MITSYQPEKHNPAALALNEIRDDLHDLAASLCPGLDVLMQGQSILLSLSGRKATFTLDPESLNAGCWAHGPLLSSSFGTFTPRYSRERMRMLAAVLPMESVTGQNPCCNPLENVIHAGYAVEMSAREIHSRGDWYVYLIRVTTPAGQTYAGSVDCEDSEDGDAIDSVTIGGMNLAETFNRAGIRQGTWPVRADAPEHLSAHLNPVGLLERLDSGALPGQVPAYWRRQFLKTVNDLPF